MHRQSTGGSPCQTRGSCDKTVDRIHLLGTRAPSGGSHATQAQWPQDVAGGEDRAEPPVQVTEDPLWNEARTLLNECKEAHIRNDLLLKRQLEVVRTVLSSLTQRSADNHSALYDKMGRMRRKR